MVSTRRSHRVAHIPPFALKSNLQTQRDAIVSSVMSASNTPNMLQASRISKSWPNRSNTGARGIRNPLAYCYINSTVQAFMHQPIFLNWIQTHNHSTRCGRRGIRIINPCNQIGAPGCTACAFKALVNAYWANTPISTIIPFPGPLMTRIENITMATTLFQPNQMDDAARLYDTFLPQLKLGSG
jgi:hypothetical protein